jgi:hypothetical protein
MLYDVSSKGAQAYLALARELLLKREGARAEAKATKKAAGAR